MRDDRGGGFGGGIGGGLYPSGMAGMSGWSINTWIIVVNVVVFLLGVLMAPAFNGADPLIHWGHFSTQTGLYELQVWRFITFQFLHAGIWHIVFNMLALFWFGPQVEHYLGSRRYLAFYLLCGIGGAALYLVLNVAGNMVSSGGTSQFPFLLPGNVGTPLVGASAGVFGVLLAGAYLRPNQRITLLLMFVIPVTLKQKTLAYGLLAIALLTLYTQGNNAGGEAGHIGGAAVGAFLIRFPRWVNWANLLPLDGFKARGHHAFGGYGEPDRPWRGSSGRSAQGGSTKGFFERRRERQRESAGHEIDRILAKIGSQGLQSLTNKERRLLEQDTERKRRG